MRKRGRRPLAPEEKRVQLRLFLRPALINWIRNFGGRTAGEAVALMALQCGYTESNIQPNKNV